MKLYIKKVWSYNPTKYKYIELNKALREYDDWIKSYLKSPFFDKETEIKSFDEWLKTEI